LRRKLSRRDFLRALNRFLVASGLAGVLGTMVAYFYPPVLEEESSVSVSVAPVSELGFDDSRKVSFGRYPGLVINTTEGLRAYRAVCTHFACVVSWNPDSGMIECPCHAGFFSPLDGSVISGPPPAPLNVLTTEIIDDVIFIKS
jgi:Rieske Fe-S protein